MPGAFLHGVGFQSVAGKLTLKHPIFGNAWVNKVCFQALSCRSLAKFATEVAEIVVCVLVGGFAVVETTTLVGGCAIVGTTFDTVCANAWPIHRPTITSRKSVKK